MSDTDSKIPKSLRVALEAGEVVPFVGAGVSMSVKKKYDDGSEINTNLFFRVGKVLSKFLLKPCVMKIDLTKPIMFFQV